MIHHSLIDDQHIQRASCETHYGMPIALELDWRTMLAMHLHFARPKDQMLLKDNDHDDEAI
jgi:hypothetical protein